MHFESLCRSGPESRTGLDDSSAVGRIMKDSIDDIFTLNSVQCSQLPVREYLIDGTGQPKEEIYLMNALADEGFTTFSRATPLNGTAVVLR